MAWTTPRTWVAGDILTSAQLNTDLRDNMLETEAALATGDGYFISAGLNDIVERKWQYSLDATLRTGTSTTYNGTLPQVTCTTGTKALVFFSCEYEVSIASAEILTSVDVTGATTIAALDDWALRSRDAVANRPRQHMQMHFFDTLTAGSNTFRMTYRVGSGTGSWSNRRILVFPM